MADFNPHQLQIHSFSMDHDIPRILSLLTAVESVDHEGVEISEPDFRTQLSLPGHDPLQDRWLIDSPDDPSSLIASAMVRVSPGTPVAEANIIVHPEWRHRGIGGALLAKVTQRASQHNADILQIYASARHLASVNFLQKHGFIPLGAYTELRLPEGVRLPPIIWPFGYEMRPYPEVNDLSILTQAMNLCYIPLWGHRAVAEKELAAWLPDFNQQGLFLVFSEKGRVIGISRAEPSTERTQKNGKPTGCIDAPGIVPQHRRLDLYRALVLTGIRWLHEQGQGIVEMESWGDKLEVLKMYRELGFKDFHQLICYQSQLTLPGRDNLLVSP